MLHEFLHLFGICADHDAHLNFLSLIGDNAIINQMGLTIRQAHLYIKTKIKR